jgi:hypothetical protein
VAKALTIAVAHLRSIVIGKRREVVLTVRLSGATTVVFALRMPGGRTLETVGRALRRGAHGVRLAVPAKARHARRLILRLAWTGHTKSLTVALRT